GECLDVKKSPMASPQRGRNGGAAGSGEARGGGRWGWGGGGGPGAPAPGPVWPLPTQLPSSSRPPAPCSASAALTWRDDAAARAPLLGREARQPSLAVARSVAQGVYLGVGSRPDESGDARVRRRRLHERRGDLARHLGQRVEGRDHAAEQRTRQAGRRGTRR